MIVLFFFILNLYILLNHLIYLTMSSESLETLIVKSKVRDYIKEKGLNTSKAVVDGNRLNLRIAEILDNAIQRAKENGRKTVKPRDI